MTKNSVICNYIAGHPDWRESLAEMQIRIKESNNYAIFNYIITADFTSPIVQEARGIIIHIPTLEVVCWPFRKFGNYGESYADKIDWSDVKVYDKIDGSIMKLWYHNAEWHISTNGCIDAGDANDGLLFRLFIESTKGLDYSILDTDYTYIFELVSPNNQIVIYYNKTMVYHLGTRNNHTGQEVDINIGIVQPNFRKISSLEDCIVLANELDGKKYEGFVVVDKNWNRIKVKSPEYILAHHLRENHTLDIKRVLAIQSANETNEFLTYFPQAKYKFDKVTLLKEELLETIHEELAQYDTTLSRKDFAIKYKDTKYFNFAIGVFFYGKHLEDIITDKFIANELKDIVL